MILDKIKKWWNSARYYIIADPADNSITLSRALFNHIRKHAREDDQARVFVFRVAQNGRYAFMPNPGISQPTQMCDVQYNDKYQCIGFETLCPSVGQIFYDYALAPTKCVKLSVSIQKTAQNKIYYQIEKPISNEKHIRKYQKG